MSICKYKEEHEKIYFLIFVKFSFIVSALDFLIPSQYLQLHCNLSPLSPVCLSIYRSNGALFSTEHTIQYYTGWSNKHKRFKGQFTFAFDFKGSVREK